MNILIKFFLHLLVISIENGVQVRLRICGLCLNDATASSISALLHRVFFSDTASAIFFFL